MENIFLDTDFAIKINRDTVLDLISCYKDSPVYEETIEEYEEVLPAVMTALMPKSLFGFGEVEPEEEIENILNLGDKVIYSIVTVGAEVSRISERYFAEGDYLKGMLVDAMADCAITFAQEQVKILVKAECKKRNIGISRRYEAPTFVPMEYQKIAFDKTEAREHLGMDITCGYMLNPVKSCCQILIITDDATLFKMDHDCRHCPNLECKSRQIIDVPIIVVEDIKHMRSRVHETSEKEQPSTLMCSYNENLRDLLVRHDIYISAPCAGKGLCGKCKIRVLAGTLAVTMYDRQFFTEEELQEGYRLACKAYPEEACTIEICQVSEERIKVLGVETHCNSEKSIIKDMQISSQDDKYGIAIDIGTTTLALSLVNRNTGEIVDTYTALNHQRAYGADVISRIQEANVGKGMQLQSVIRRDLLQGIHMLLEANRTEGNQITSIVIAANTTMIHLLLGLSCETLGVAPFIPVDINFMELGFEDVFGDIEAVNSDITRTRVTILPGVSTFVGADIVSGLYECFGDGFKGYSMLVDLGTNGEMALGNRDKILVASTAMGPACEGGNISCGMGGVQGAINTVSIQGKDVQYTTIDNELPIGICGTGVLEIVAELLANEWIDETGLLETEYFEEGFPIAVTETENKIIFMQKDVREIQLAKAAVRAGVETLIKRMGINYSDIEHVYIAGGFGFYINIEKAVAIGLFPEELEDKIQSVGNTSLKGAIRYLKEEDGRASLQVQKMVAIVARSEEVGLSEDQYFNEQYVEQMLFE